MNDSAIVSTTYNGRTYEIYPDPETGLMQVFCEGSKVGSTQTERAARLIARNHARRAEARTEAPREYRRSANDTAWTTLTGSIVQKVTRAGREYSIVLEADTGLHAVLAEDLDGNVTRVGRSQTLAGATLIRRNHAHSIERRIGGLDDPTGGQA